MGSTKKTIQVSSTVYGMSGDYKDSDNIVASVVLNNVLKNTNSIAEDLTDIALYGPYSNNRNFYNWCNKINYKGNLITEVFNQNTIGHDVLLPYLPSYPGKTVNIQRSSIELADISIFADKWLLENDLPRRFTNWVVEFFTSTSIKITFEDNSTQLVSLPVDYDRDNKYITSYYTVYEPGEVQDLIVGSTTISTTLPNTIDYSLVSDIDLAATIVDLDTTVHVLSEFSNSDPNIESTNVTTNIQSFVGNNTVKIKSEYLGAVTGSTTANKDYTYYQLSTYIIENNVSTVQEIIDHGTYTETKTTTTTTEILTPSYEYSFNEQITNNNVFIGEYVYIYLLGSGINTLDDLIEDVSTVPEFHPIIPLRLNNVSIRDLADTSIYDQTKTAYKKLTKDSSIDELLDQIEDNDSIDDIDFCFMQPGVSINTTSKYELRYVYEFLKGLIVYQDFSNFDYINWSNNYTDNVDFKDLYELWVVAQSNPNDVLYGTPRPTNGTTGGQGFNLGTVVRSNLVLKTNNTLKDNFKINISWTRIFETIHTGLGKVGAKPGDLWWGETIYNSSYPPWWQAYYTGDNTEIDTLVSFNNFLGQQCVLYWQVDVDTYKILNVVDLNHGNHVYGGTKDFTIAARAILDEDKSGFIIPLHEPTLKKLSGTYRNEVAIRSQNLLFNSYVIVKQKWYQSTYFKIILVVALVVVIIAVTIYTGGVGTGPAGKAALTITGATLAGASTATLIYIALVQLAVSVIASTIIKLILEETFKLVFDDELSSLLATIGTIITTLGISAAIDGTTFVEAASLFYSDALNVLILTVDLAQAGMTYVNTVQQNELVNEVNNAERLFKENQKIIEKNTELFGLDLEENNLNSVVLENLVYPEKRDNFLQRATVTGSEIRQMTLSMVYDFVKHSKDLNKLL